MSSLKLWRFCVQFPFESLKRTKAVLDTAGVNLPLLYFKSCGVWRQGYSVLPQALLFRRV